MGAVEQEDKSEIKKRSIPMLQYQKYVTPGP